jgi:dimethylhistidine N-methyltransferase
MIVVEQSLTPALAQFAEEVRSGLKKKQKQLPSKYFYDAVGSALFETICVLPEYGLTRADERLLKENAGEIAKALPKNLTVAELGSGSGKKTRFLLEALCLNADLTYYPIEISAAALSTCEREMGGVSGLSVKGIESEYLEGLGRVSEDREDGGHLLVLFLGSTIGNFDNGEDRRFLQTVRQALKPGDCLLLGADLVKPEEKLVAAYDDPTGVTAAFNLNILARINRELGGDFDLRMFEHVARFNCDTSSIEMHLRARRRQIVTVSKAECMVRFNEGETIWTESSHKYGKAELVELAKESGFGCRRQWVDGEWEFAENLFAAV